MEWLTRCVFFACVLCAFGLDSPRPPSSPSGIQAPRAHSRSGVMPGDVVEGDIVLDHYTAALYRGESRNAMANVKKWPGGVVPYILDSSVDDYLKTQIEKGIEHYHKYTCLRFVKRTNQKDYIRVVKPRSGCNSMVGRVGNGEQVLNMGDGCQYVGLVLHEFGHAIGYFHEHNRPDRDNTINVLWDNVQPSFKDAFYKYKFNEADTQGFPYDLTSIMHYENTAFGKAGFCKTTITVRSDPSYEISPVYLREFSPQDIKKINKLYGCPVNNLPPVVLPGGGNPDPNACKCEDKYADRCPGWASSGECSKNHAWMSQNCPKSCRTCGEPDSDCKDEYPVACSDWGNQGECTNNPQWMNIYCTKFCGACGTQVPPTGAPQTQPPQTQPPQTQPPQTQPPQTQPPGNCKDTYPNGCPDWKKWGWCNDGQHDSYMKSVCKFTCGYCGGGSGICKDVYPQHCPGYKKQGMCTDPKYDKYVREVCKFTCNYC